MTKTARCIVTGHNEAGESIILQDGAAKNVVRPIPSAPEVALINLWLANNIPADVKNFSDITNQQIPLAPTSNNGVIFRMVDFPPDADYLHHLDSKTLQTAWDKLDADQKDVQKKSAPHPLMHKTPTLDFGIVMSGEIYLLVDKEERHLTAGDTVIQRATNHAWSNRSKEICRMAFILISAQV